MSIVVTCPNPACARTHKVKDKYAGKRCHCPDCHAVLKVPGAQTLPPPAGPTTPAPMIRYDDILADLDLGERTPAPMSHARNAEDAETVDLDALSFSEAPTASPREKSDEEMAIPDFGNKNPLADVPDTLPPMRGNRPHSEPGEDEFVDLLEPEVAEDVEFPVSATKPVKRKQVVSDELEEDDELTDGEFEQKDKRGSKWLWLIIGVAVVALGAGAAVYFEPWK